MLSRFSKFWGRKGWGLFLVSAVLVTVACAKPVAADAVGMWLAAF